MKQKEFNVFIPADNESRKEDQVFRTHEVGIDFADSDNDFGCCVTIQRTESGLIVKPNNNIGTINAYRAGGNNKEIELRINKGE